MNAFTQALDAILAANLPTATEVIAIRLLAEASRTNGQYNCTWDDYLTLCNYTNRRAAQRHLTRLSKLRIIHYSTNERVYVTFWAWLGNDESRADLVHLTRQNGTSSAPNDDEPRAKMVHPTRQIGAWDDGSRADLVHPTRQNGTSDAPNRRATYTRARAPVLDRETEIYINNNTDQSLSVSRSDLQPEQQRIYDALTDPEVNIQSDNAVKVAQFLDFRLVMLMIATWWPDRERFNAGALFKRLMNPGKFRPGVPGKDFLASDFYRRHYPEDEAIDLPAPTRDGNTWEGVILT